MPLGLDKIGNLLVVYGINVLGAALIAVIGWWLAGVIARLVRRMLLGPAHLDLTVSSFLSSLSYYAVLVVSFVLILQVIGIQATSLVAVLGAASLAIGLALQGTLSNMAAGVMLLIFRPLRIGDTVEVAGKNGTVKNLNLFMTELATPDNLQVLIPNGQVWGAALTNYSTYPMRRVSATMVVPAERDAASIATELRDALANDRRVLKTPPSGVTISNVTDKGLELSMEAWVNAQDAGAVRSDLVHSSHKALTSR